MEKVEEVLDQIPSCKFTPLGVYWHTPAEDLSHWSLVVKARDAGDGNFGVQILAVPDSLCGFSSSQSGKNILLQLSHTGVLGGLIDWMLVKHMESHRWMALGKCNTLWTFQKKYLTGGVPEV